MPQYAAGLIKIGEDFYYIRSNGQAATGNYWVTNNNGVLPSGMYTVGADGKMVTEEEEPEQPGPGETPEQPKPEDPKPEQPPVKEGIVNENGVLYYYENGIRAYAKGIVKLTDEEGNTFYIYVRSNGQMAIGSYWPTNTNGLVPQGMYTFDENGKMLNPPTTGGGAPGEPDPGVPPVDPNPGETPEDPDPEEPKPEQPPVKEGIVEENGVLYYYENGIRAYAKGAVKLTDEEGKTFYIYVRSNGQLATGVYWPTNHNGLMPYKGYDWGTDGRLYM